MLGFLPVSTGRRARYRRDSDGFNPVLGFLPVSTTASHVKTSALSFNPVLGFLPVSTHYESPPSASSTCFNPVLGFLPVSTRALGVVVVVVDRFQSRAGFSPCLDDLRRRPARRGRNVSIPCWVFSLSRREDGEYRNFRHVSIPCWVFSLSRLPLPLRRTPLPPRFNPVLGFLPVSTVPDGRQHTDVALFQSRAGFSPCLDCHARRREYRRLSAFQSRAGFSPCLDTVATERGGAFALFQSRAGFSPCLDIHSACFLISPVIVSIPCWVFSLSRLAVAYGPRLKLIGFNPVLGFLPVSTKRNEARSFRGNMFQSRAGFSPCLDHRLRRRQVLRRVVSIPCWVFSLSRRSLDVRRL